MMGEVIKVDFRLRPEKVEKASRMIVAAAQVAESYADAGIVELAQEEKEKALRNLSPREVKEVNNKINQRQTDKAS